MARKLWSVPQGAMSIQSDTHVGHGRSQCLGVGPTCVPCHHMNPTNDLCSLHCEQFPLQWSVLGNQEAPSMWSHTQWLPRNPAKTCTSSCNHQVSPVSACKAPTVAGCGGFSLPCQPVQSTERQMFQAEAKSSDPIPGLSCGWQEVNHLSHHCAFKGLH